MNNDGSSTTQVTNSVVYNSITHYYSSREAQERVLSGERVDSTRSPNAYTAAVAQEDTANAPISSTTASGMTRTEHHETDNVDTKCVPGLILVHMSAEEIIIAQAIQESWADQLQGTTKPDVGRSVGAVSILRPGESIPIFSLVEYWVKRLPHGLGSKFSDKERTRLLPQIIHELVHGLSSSQAMLALLDRLDIALLSQILRIIRSPGIQRSLIPVLVRRAPLISSSTPDSVPSTFSPIIQVDHRVKGLKEKSKRKHGPSLTSIFGDNNHNNRGVGSFSAPQPTAGPSTQPDSSLMNSGVTLSQQIEGLTDMMKEQGRLLKKVARRLG
ncbi:hypothetical protein BDN72DRAFT_849025 [Pluteus cervinus]|uniref:Uncharacterized protein n=1 Tax=Pluteus cervinus TaxID=181527 RepID=A0ACD3A944_9AGAR|nr:hypothetical protein BDN72DRAFT_849025 [Pluteus cervinus]